MLVFQEIVELVKALAWPVVVVFFGLRFQEEFKALLVEMPAVMRRVKSAHGLGIEIELDKIEEDLPIAELQTQALSLKSLPKPEISKSEKEGD